MTTPQSESVDLRTRFNVANGRFFGEYRYKNLNWYLGRDVMNRENPGKWFLFGDIRDEDVPVLGEILEEGEVLMLGWKDMGPNEFYNDFFRDGGGLWLAITRDGEVPYDIRRDGRIREAE